MGASFALNINWQVVDVDDPHQPMRVVAPSDLVKDDLL